MKYTEIIEKLQNKEENKNKIIIVKCGAFFVSLGKDAIILHELLGIKITCQKTKLCKAGVPVTSIFNYVDSLESLGYSFLIYDYSSKTKEVKLEYTYEGKEIEESRTCLECTKCSGYNPWKDDYLNIIDAKLNCQRIYLRIMKNNRWIDEKKYKIAFEMLLEIGKILGGLIKYYAKDTKK